MVRLAPLLVPPKYRDKRTERFAAGERIREFQTFKEQAERRLDILETVANRNDLMLLPSNRFEALGVTEKGSSAFASISNGVCVSSGRKSKPGPATSRFAIITLEETTMARDPIHPGKFLADELDALA